MSGINKLLYSQDKTELPKMLTVKEVMENLHIKSEKTLKRIIRDEELPALKVGRNYLFPSDIYEEWIKKRIGVK